MDVRNRGVLVTGASRGLGAALAKELAARGAKVALVARGSQALREVEAEIRAKGGDAHAIPADVGAKDDIAAIAGAAASLLGAVDIVVHNASTLGRAPLALLADTASEEFERVLAVNVVGPFRLTKALLGSMLFNRRGLFVHVSSDAAIAAYPLWGAYSVSKSALDQLSRVWAVELQGTGVGFFGVDPGEMDTAMHAAAIPDAEKQSLGRPEDVARTIARMIEDDSISSGARLDVTSWRPSP